jgi:prolipoprotein diacylglyceryltransferase
MGRRAARRPGAFADLSFLHSTAGPQAHVALEALAYLVAGRVYWAQAGRAPRPAKALDRWKVLACVVFGAALGSKSLHVLEHLGFLLQSGGIADFLGGKSVLGGLMGGTLGAEAGKKWIGWRQSTGDAWVPAIAAGLVVGRLGCQLSGLWDQTFGSPTTLPWGWDYGDGIARHPTALYEMVLVAACWLAVRRLPAQPSGVRFAAFMAGYCAIRLGLEFLKPPFGPAPAPGLPVQLHAGFTAIQWAAVAGMLAYLALLRYRRRQPPSRAD